MDKQGIREANIRFYTLLGDSYAKEPHYKPENIKRVRRILKRIQEETQGDHLLDMGCGTGFIIDIARKYFKVIRGVDITPAMLSKVNITGHDIEVSDCPSDRTSFADDYFDVCTVYSVLHHLDGVEGTFKEAYRVLKAGGILYTDLDPNYYFWEALRGLPSGKYSSIIDREIKSVAGDVFEIENMDKELLMLAAPLKYTQGGFKEEYLKSAVIEAGFSKCSIEYNWFLGEGSITHGDAQNSAKHFREYMQNILPLSRPLFKYLSIVAVK